MTFGSYIYQRSSFTDAIEADRSRGCRSRSSCLDAAGSCCQDATPMRNSFKSSPFHISVPETVTSYTGTSSSIRIPWQDGVSQYL